MTREWIITISTYQGEFFCSHITCFVKLILILEHNLSLTFWDMGDEIKKGIDLSFIEWSIEGNFSKLEVIFALEWTPWSGVRRGHEWLVYAELISHLEESGTLAMRMVLSLEISFFFFRCRLPLIISEISNQHHWTGVERHFWDILNSEQCQSFVVLTWAMRGLIKLSKNAFCEVSM